MKCKEIKKYNNLSCKVHLFKRTKRMVVKPGRAGWLDRQLDAFSKLKIRTIKIGCAPRAALISIMRYIAAAFIESLEWANPDDD